MSIDLNEKFEITLKISKPSEKLLEREKRNKRKSKIYPVN